MVFLINQSEILEKIANELYNLKDDLYDKLSCDFKFISDFNSIGVTIYVTQDDEESCLDPPDGFASRCVDLAEELRALMKAHTGGEWTSFTLTLNKDGKAHTKFHYPEAKSE